MRVHVKKKRGIRFQSRHIVSAILLLVQFFLLFMAAYHVTQHTGNVVYRYIYLVSELLGGILVIFIVNRRGNPSYKIAWIIFILVFPIFGITVFLLFGGGRVLPNFRKKMLQCEEYYLAQIGEDDGIHDLLHDYDIIHSRQADYLSAEANCPLFRNTEMEFLSPGEVFFPRFLEELSKAEKYIYLEFFIVAEGEMWESIFEILKEKAQNGVEVKLLFDDFGSIKRQHEDFITRVQNAGIEVAVFNKIGPSINIFMNNRNHRKIVVIDGRVAATGGLNLADEYINRIERFGYWVDCALMLRGDAVRTFLAMFCAMWKFTTGNGIDFQSHLAENMIKNENFALPYCDDPFGDNDPAEGIYMQILNTAQKYVYITTPYLIIDSTMIQTLRMAAKSGIDVRIITPHIPDKWYVHPVTQYNYRELLETGVRIYEYTPGFMHSKLFVSDDSVATVGTVNMDYRSFALHFESGVWISNTEAVTQIRDNIVGLFDQCHEITLEEWLKEPWYRRLKRAILNLFSPFL